MAFVGAWSLPGALPRAGRSAISVARPYASPALQTPMWQAASMAVEEPSAAATPGATAEAAAATTPAAPAVDEVAAAAVQDTTTKPASAAWTAALGRLSAATPSVPMAEVEAALEEADGIEMKALELLTASSERIAQREAQIVEYRASGRISAMEEAALRRRVVGSAADFFKSYVEVKGEYVDQGYVDESSDTMGKAAKAVQQFFGKFTKTPDADSGKK
eukprot:TRINITY_DN1661_c0_g1_i1.p1 TRINITY_DN1661_c0_g1~~TRINITY_DN1661_c0_g1_i1.p1  ORF type:complete len:219 (-),score=63.40 TRINITY_DN1661_c0_g1_i1:145-801(-)